MKSKHILFIDDDPDDAAFFKEALTELDKDIRVEYAATGDGAIQILLKEAKNLLPDLIFMDINMPMMNGWETLTEIKRLLAHYSIPIIMFSTMNFDNVGFTPADIGATAFMTKPDSMSALKNCLIRLFASLA